MGPLAVVDPKPSVGQGAQLRQGFEEVRVQHLGPVAPIKTFDIGVLVRLTWLDVVHRDAVLGAPVHEGLGGELGPVVVRRADGQPWSATSSLRTRVTRRLGSDTPMAISKPSRLPSSMTVSSRICRRS